MPCSVPHNLMESNLRSFFNHNCFLAIFCHPLLVDLERDSTKQAKLGRFDMNPLLSFGNPLFTFITKCKESNPWIAHWNLFTLTPCFLPVESMSIKGNSKANHPSAFSPFSRCPCCGQIRAACHTHPETAVGGIAAA